MPRQSGGGMPNPGRPGGAPIKYVGAPRQSGGGALIQSGGGKPSPRRFGGGCLKKGRFKRFGPVREMWVSKRRRKKKYMRRSYNPIDAMDGLRRGGMNTHFMILYTGGQYMIEHISEYTNISIDPNILGF